MAHGLAEDPAAKQASVASELDQWLLNTEVSRTLQACTTDDVLCYMAGYYTVAHRGWKAADGSLSPGTDAKGAIREELKVKGQIASKSVIKRYLYHTGHRTGCITCRRS
ncbi:hypothetical protein GPECTOR_1g932 [Gonium pectorale]|uniref:Uncharacterized protein n=1 Tax=Gonium pectorale TaxID=33097 RepID=A0A150H4P6_GONPE|nr:hypothetical protein GPECTOR_1g932 [Gonium pectorale]|eukprot:KXZ57032.1 hypothetical protein GPECTOR_1g932 [Gonium pectorale]